MEFRVNEPEPYIPDHLTIPQFVFDTTVVPRPQRPREAPYFIEEATGRGVFEDEVSPHTPGSNQHSLIPSRRNAGVMLLRKRFD